MPILMLLLALLAAKGAAAEPSAATDGTRVTPVPVAVPVAVLAFRGEERARTRWQPTMDYLTDAIPDRRFELVPLGLDALLAGVGARRFDFVLTNPGQYVELEAGYGIARLATLVNLVQGRPFNEFGSVIFARADQSGIRTLSDLRGRTLAGVAKRAFGGFQLAWFELLRLGIDPFEDTRRLVFTGLPQDQVVYAVRDRVADAGTVRTGVLERMADEGLIDLADFRVLNRRRLEKFPLMLSTGLYPEWAFARTPDTDEDLARRVAVALLDLPGGSNPARAGHYAGWQVPGNYNPIHQVFKAIHYGPYRNLGRVGPVELLRRYWPVLLLFSLLLMLALYHTVATRRMSERLMVAKERAESASRAKGAFLANMSHEIRTPLNAVLGYAQILRRAADIPDRYRPQLSAINDAGNHLLSLLNDILDLSRIEAGADEVVNAEFSLARLVNGLVSVFEMRCQDQGLQFRLDADLPVDQLVIGDPGKIRQVLYNLLGNAVKFTDDGTVTLRVRQRGDSTEFAVEDTGRGMTDTELASIFEPFKQAEQGLRLGGTGLGLDISRRYVTMLGGDLRVESAPGQGACFSFKLALRITNTGYQNGQDPDRVTWYRLTEGQAVRALVVDDVKINRAVMAQTLTDAGVEVDCAANGQQALEAIEARRPDIVWMDLRMPLMGGEQAVAVIRRRYPGTIRCVAVSASVTADHTSRYQEQGFDALLPKPYTMDQLFQLTEQLLPVHFERLASANETAEQVAWSQVSKRHRGPLIEAATGQQVTALKRELAAMRGGNAADRALAARLQPLLARFDMEAIQQAIEELSDG